MKRFFFFWITAFSVGCISMAAAKESGSLPLAWCIGYATGVLVLVAYLLTFPLSSVRTPSPEAEG